MASLTRPIRKTTYFSILKTTIPQIQRIQQNPTLVNHTSYSPVPTTTTAAAGAANPFLLLSRNYMSELRKSAIHDSILRLLRNEIQYELDRSPSTPHITQFNSFTIDDCPTEKWIRLKRKFSENEEVSVEATMFDDAVPVSKSGGPDTRNDVHLHITMIVGISKGDGDVFEIMCSAWPNGVEITKLFIRRSKTMPAQAYTGPDFDDLDDELQDALYEFLEARGVNDDMVIFLHEYMKNKDKTELIRWINTLKSYIEEK